MRRRVAAAGIPQGDSYFGKQGRAPGFAGGKRTDCAVYCDAGGYHGAGDAFIGSFAVFLGAGLPEKEAVTRANLYAAMSKKKVGTQKSFPTGAEFAAEWGKRGGKS